MFIEIERIEMDMSYSSQCLEVMYIGPASFAGGETVVGLCLGENPVLRCEHNVNLSASLVVS